MELGNIVHNDADEGLQVYQNRAKSAAEQSIQPPLLPLFIVFFAHFHLFFPLLTDFIQNYL